MAGTPHGRPTPGRAPGHAGAVHPSVIDAISDAYLCAAADGVVVGCNRAAQELFGIAGDELVGRGLDDVLLPVASHGGSAGGLWARLADDAPVEAWQVTVATRAGERCLEVSAWATDDGQPQWHVVCRDVTERVRLEDEVLASASHTDMVERLVGMGTWELDVATGVVAASAQVHRILDVAEDEVMTYHTFMERVHPEEREWMQRLVTAAVTDGTPYRIQFRIVRADETVWWVAAEGERITGAAGRTRLHGTLRDITARKTAELELAALATSDPLTGLANRTRLAEALNRALRASARTAAPVALLLLDLDRFKPVNDTYGHPIGDEVLITLAGRFADCLRPEATLGRTGGDEFAVVMPGAGRDGAAAVARRLIDAAARPITTSTGEAVRVGASVGIAVAATPQQGAGELRREADLALYAAKRRGRGRHEVFAPGLSGPSDDAMTVHVADARAWARYVRALRAAIAAREQQGVMPEDLRAPDAIRRTLDTLLAGIDHLASEHRTAELILPDRDELADFVSYHRMVQHRADGLVRAGTLAAWRPLSACRFWARLQQVAASPR